MPITIVSAPTAPRPTSAAGASVGAGDTPAGLDFASLLLGQLFAAPTVPAATDGAAVAPSRETPEQAGEALAASDPAMLLAALGLSAPATRADTAPVPATDEVAGELQGLAPPTGDKGKPSSPALAAQLQTKSNPPAGDIGGEPAAIQAQSPANNAPAKFAVPADAMRAEPAPTVNHAAVDSSAVSQQVPLIQASAANPHAQHAPRPETQSLPTPLHDTRWHDDFSQKIVWLASHDKQSAELTLNPPQMGSIQISLNIDQDKATASFASANADVREAIETALPKLREMLAGVGIELGQTNVSAESFKHSGQSAQQTPGGSPGANGNGILATDSPGDTTVASSTPARKLGMVDIFA